MRIAVNTSGLGMLAQGMNAWDSEPNILLKYVIEKSKSLSRSVSMFWSSSPVPTQHSFFLFRGVHCFLFRVYYCLGVVGLGFRVWGFRGVAFRARGGLF